MFKTLEFNMRPFILATAIAFGTLPLALTATAATAQEAPAGDPAARAFIDKLAADAFGVLRDKSVSKAEGRAKFRDMLQQNVALTEIGNRLIRKHRAEITPAQLAAYQQAFPEFILNAYADRLYDYQDATIKTMRVNARGPFTEVHTRVQRPGSQPIDAIWQVKKTPEGRYQVNNLTVSNINLSVTQEADFTQQIKAKGFDSLITFLKSANAKSVTTRA